MKFLLIEDNIIWYIENIKESIKKLLELVSEYGKYAGYNSVHRNHLQFYILTIKNQKVKLRHNPHPSLQQK